MIVAVLEAYAVTIQGILAAAAAVVVVVVVMVLMVVVVDDWKMDVALYKDEKNRGKLSKNIKISCIETLLN